MQRRDPSYSVRWRGILRVKSVNTMAIARSGVTASPTRLETGREREREKLLCAHTTRGVDKNKKAMIIS